MNPYVLWELHVPLILVVNHLLTFFSLMLCLGFLGSSSMGDHDQTMTARTTGAAGDAGHTASADIAATSCAMAAVLDMELLCISCLI